MDNQEKPNLSEQELTPDKKSALIENLVSDFLMDDLATLEKYKTILSEKLETMEKKIQDKKQALDSAIEEKQPADVIEILSLELQQRTLVLEDTKMHLSALGIAIDKK